MKKIVALLTSMTLSITSFIVVNAAEPYKNTNLNVGSSYSSYHVGNMDFLVPAYYSEEPTLEDNEVTFIDKTYGAALSINCTAVPSENLQDMTLRPKLVMEELFKLVGKEAYEVTTLGPTETVSARGYYCYMTTSQRDAKDAMVKMAAFFNSSTNEIYTLGFMYLNALEGTYYVNDFYKFLYDDPYSYDPATSASQSAPAPAQSAQSSSDDWQALRDYVDVMGSYVDTMEAIDNADNYGDVLGSLYNFYGDVAAYGQKYGY